MFLNLIELKINMSNFIYCKKYSVQGRVQMSTHTHTHIYMCWIMRHINLKKVNLIARWWRNQEMQQVSLHFLKHHKIMGNKKQLKVERSRHEFQKYFLYILTHFSPLKIVFYVSLTEECLEIALRSASWIVGKLL